MNYPIIADEDSFVAKSYGKIHPDANEKLTVRSVFFIDASNTYPPGPARRSAFGERGVWSHSSEASPWPALSTPFQTRRALHRFDAPASKGIGMSEWTAETAEWYADKYGEYATNRLAVDALDLSSDVTIVDVGCGTGAALRHVASGRALSGRASSGGERGGPLIGVDPIARMVEIARERAASHAHGDRLEFRQGPAEKLPVDDDSADVVFAFDSFDHWQDHARGLAEVRRVLRHDGLFVIVKDGGAPGGGKSHAVLLAALADAGFDVEEEQNITKEDVSFQMWRCRVPVQAS